MRGLVLGRTVRLNQFTLAYSRHTYLGQRSLVTKEPRSNHNPLRIPHIELAIQRLLLHFSPIFLKLGLRFHWFVQPRALIGSTPQQSGIQLPGPSLPGLALGPIGIVLRLEVIEHLLNAKVGHVVGMQVEQNGDHRRAALRIAILDEIDLILGRVLPALHPVLGGDLNVDVRDGELVAPTLGNVGRRALDHIIFRGTAPVGTKVGGVNDSELGR